jgi:hypothetical protein
MLASQPHMPEAGSSSSQPTVPAWGDCEDELIEDDNEDVSLPSADTYGDGSVQLEASPFPPLPPKARMAGPFLDASAFDFEGPSASSEGPATLVPSAPPPESAPTSPSLLPSAPSIDDHAAMPSAPPLDDDDDLYASAPLASSPDFLPRYQHSSG